MSQSCRPDKSQHILNQEGTIQTIWKSHYHFKVQDQISSHSLKPKKSNNCNRNIGQMNVQNKRDGQTDNGIVVYQL